MPTQKQRREAARRHLERQVQRRAEREATRKKFTMVASIVGTLAIIGLVIGLVAGLGGSDKGNSTASGSSPTASGTSAATTPATDAPTTPGSTKYSPAQGAPVTFQGVTVIGAKDLSGYPTVTSTANSDPAKLEYKDLVVGTGKAATPTSSVTVQYVGILYKGGTEPFDSSWSRGEPAPFSLSQVVPGFTQGIGGGSGTRAMKVGGRRLIIMPAAMGYGAQSPSADIPANSPLVFVVDLKSVDS